MSVSPHVRVENIKYTHIYIYVCIYISHYITIYHDSLFIACDPSAFGLQTWSGKWTTTLFQPWCSRGEPLGGEPRAEFLAKGQTQAKWKEASDPNS